MKIHVEIIPEQPIIGVEMEGKSEKERNKLKLKWQKQIKRMFIKIQVQLFFKK